MVDQGRGPALTNWVTELRPQSITYTFPHGHIPVRELTDGPRPHNVATRTTGTRSIVLVHATDAG